MIRALISRIRQGYHTYPFPRKEPVLPQRFKGRPLLNHSRCSGCGACHDVCPTGAAAVLSGKVTIDLGKCIFCGACADVCAQHVIEFTGDYKLAASKRDDLLVNGQEARLAQALDRESRRIFGRSLKLRQVSAGGCNACEADTNVLTTLAFDLGRFGIQFVASPRHADGVLVTGPVTENMLLALKKTYDAVPAPKFVIAVGACAISGGLYREHSQCNNGAEETLKVDLYVPGCPPHPYTILDGLVRFLGKVKS